MPPLNLICYKFLIGNLIENAHSCIAILLVVLSFEALTARVRLANFSAGFFEVKDASRQGGSGRGCY